MPDFRDKRPLPPALRNLCDKWQALPNGQSPWLKLSRFLFLPCLITWAVLSAQSPDLPGQLSELHKLHLLCLCTALTAFWSRSTNKWALQPTDLVVGIIVSMLLGWVWITLPDAPVPETSFPYAVLTLDAALLFYAMSQAMRFQSVATLAILVLGHLFCWLAALKAPQQSILTSQPQAGLGPMVWSLVFFGGFLWMLTLTDRPMGRRRWALLLLFLILPMALFWTARLNTVRSAAQSPNRLFQYPNRDVVVKTAHTLFRDHMLEGVRLGGLAPHLAGQQTTIDGGKIAACVHIEALPSTFAALPALTSLSPHATSQKKTDYPASGESPFLIASGLSLHDTIPPPLSSFQILSVELGVAGTGLLLAAILLLTVHSLTRIALAPPSAAALRAAGLLGLWLSTMAEGFMSLSLLHPYGILLCSILAGAIWGVVRNLPHRRIMIPVFVPKTETIPKEGEDNEWDSLSPREQRTKLLHQQLNRDTNAMEKPTTSLLDEPEDRTNASLYKTTHTPPSPWQQWLPLPQRWITFLVALVAAVLLAQITALPLKGLLLARSVVDSAKRTGTEAGRLLDKACRLNGYSSQPEIDKVHHLLANIQHAGITQPTVEKIEKTLCDAIARHPFRDETYALLASFHSSQGEVYKTGRAIADGREHCPQSLTLALWRVSYARLSGIPSDTESAWQNVIELTPFDKPEIKSIWLRELLGYLESKNDSAKALDVARTLYFLNPGDAAARNAIEHIHSQQAQHFTNMQKSLPSQ